MPRFKTLATIVTTMLIMAAVATAAAFAHEDEEVGEYAIVVGFLNEPAYEGQMNAVSVRVTQEKAQPAGGHHESSESEPEIVPVEGLQDTLQVEVTHVASSVSATLTFHAYSGDPGHYTAPLIPTSPGHYRFRLFGTIEEMEIDETYDSISGGGNFDDVQPAAAIQFPEPVPSARELESAVRGALEAAERAQDTAISARDAASAAQDAAIAAGEADDDDGVSNAAMMGIIGIALGAIGAALGAFALFKATRPNND